MTSVSDWRILWDLRLAAKQWVEGLLLWNGAAYWPLCAAPLVFCRICYESDYVLFMLIGKYDIDKPKNTTLFDE